MITWHDVPLETSERVCAEAYDAENQRIIVRFRRSGTEYWYGDCTAGTWQDFTTPGQSRGKYIHRHLDPNPNRGYWDSARTLPRQGDISSRRSSQRSSATENRGLKRQR